jgi:hypothetical protein
MIRVWRWDPIFAKLKPGRKSVKGEAKDDKRPISNVQQVISSQHLFNRTSYDHNTVCEYHFIIENTTTVNITFNKIHLEEERNRILSTNFSHCNDAIDKKHKDYIELNVKFDSGQSHVFCGRPEGKIYRVVEGEDLPLTTNGQRELVITFWSDSSMSGRGFTGYLVKQEQPSEESVEDQQ